MKRFALTLAATLVSFGAGAFDFAAFPAGPVYTGKPKINIPPDWQSYRTRLKAAAAGGVTYAGHYTFMMAGCGTGCRSISLIDVQSGAISPFPLGGEANVELDISYKPTSRLVVARYRQNNQCMQELLDLQNGKFKLLKKEKIAARNGVCPAF